MRAYPVKLQLKTSVEQAEQIAAAAELAGVSVCRFLRERATAQPWSSATSAATIMEIRRIGGMVKIMLRERRIGAQEIKAALERLQAAIESGERGRK